MSSVLSELKVMLGIESDAFVDGLGVAEDALKELGISVPKILEGLSFSAAIAGVVELGEQFETASHKIEQATGASGEALEGLEQSLQNVYATSARSVEDIASVLSTLSVRTGATGDDLESLTRATLAFAKATGSDLQSAVQANSKLFAQWRTPTQDQALAMDMLVMASEKSATSVQALTATMTAVSPMAREMGYSFQGTLALVANFALHGLDAETVIGSLRMAMGQWAKEGNDSKAMLASLIKKMEAAKTDTEALTLATNAHIRGAALFTDAVRQGVFATGEMNQALASSAGTAQRVSADTGTLRGAFTQLGNELSGVFAPIGEAFVGWLTKVVNSISGVIDWMGKLVQASRESSSGFNDWLVSHGIAKYGPGGPNDPGGLLAAAPYSPGASTTRLQTGNGYFGAPSGVTPTTQNSLNTPSTTGTGQTGGGEGGGGTGGQMQGTWVGMPYMSLVATEEQKEWNAALEKSVKIVADWLQISEPWGNKLETIKSDLGNTDWDQWMSTLSQLPTTGTASAEVLGEIGSQIDLLARNTQMTTDAFHAFGMQTSEELQHVAQATEESYRLMVASGQATQKELTIAALKTAQAQADAALAAGTMTQQVYDKTTQQIKQDLASLDDQQQTKLFEQIDQAANQMFSQLENRLAQDLTHWKSWSKTLHDLFTSLAQDLFKILEKMLFGQLQQQLFGTGGKGGGTGIFGGLLSQLMGHGGGGGGGGVQGLNSVGGLSVISSALESNTSSMESNTSAMDSNTSGVAQTAAGVVQNTVDTVTNTAAVTANTAAVGAESTSGFGGFFSGLIKMFSAAGGGDVPADMAMFVHANEMVLPANIAQGFRNLFSSAAPSYGIPGAVASGGGGINPIAFSNCHFGAGLTQQSVSDMFQIAFRQAKAAGGFKSL
jgi:hypothetical protein